MTPKLKTIDDIADLSGKRVFLRLTLNVPLNDGTVAEDYRIEKGLPTLRKLLERGAIVTIGSHHNKGEEGLQVATEYLAKKLEGSSYPGTYSVLPDLRSVAGEKENSEEYVRKLAENQDIYVNEDFAVAHRAHASVVGLPKLLPSFVGYQFATEVQHLSSFLSPKEPCIVILGGAKIETKLPMIKAFLPKAEKIFLAGKFAAEVLMDPILKNERVILPEDVISHDGAVVDIGPKALMDIEAAVRNCASVIWNGPLGYFEAGFDKSTKSLAYTIAGANVESVVGGGDSMAAIKSLGLLDKFTFVSTGGGAMLDYLVDGSLPAMDAILESKVKLPRSRSKLQTKIEENI